jgi:hypothetical protein
LTPIQLLATLQKRYAGSRADFPNMCPYPHLSIDSIMLRE